MLRVRVDQVHDQIEDQILSWLKKYGNEWLMVRHETIQYNPHYHVWINSEFKEVTLRMSLKTYVKGLQGNKDYAIQKCSEERYEEFLTYLFNHKQGNKAYFVSQRGVDNWEEYRARSDSLTEDYIAQKKIVSKNDIITMLLTNGKEYESPDEIFDEVMEVSRSNNLVLSVNAIREIIIYVGYNGGNRSCRGTVRSSVLKIFS